MKRKGERTDKHRNQSHPFQVALAATAGPGGYDAMYRWAAWFDHVTTGNGLHGMCWCFSRPEVADAFATDFGGRRVDRRAVSGWLKVDQPDRREIERRARASMMTLDKVMGGRSLDGYNPFRGADRIPFSSFNDPADVARSHAALEKAWAVVMPQIPEADRERERVRLAYLVASFALVAVDEDELARRAVNRFLEG